MLHVITDVRRDKVEVNIKIGTRTRCMPSYQLEIEDRRGSLIHRSVKILAELI